MTRDDILRMVRDNRDRLRQMHVRELSLFGSFARDEARDDSDIDFLVELDETTFDAYMSVKELLEQLLGRRVDLVMTSAIKDRLREAILSEAVRAA